MAGATSENFRVEPWGRLWAVMDHSRPVPARVAQYQKRENAERHAARLQEKWGN